MSRYAQSSPYPLSPDYSDEDLWTFVEEQLRADDEAMAEINEYVSEGLGNWPEIAGLLADLSRGGLIKALAEMPSVAAMPAYHLDLFAKLARIADEVCAKREEFVQGAVESSLYDERSI